MNWTTALTVLYPLKLVQTGLVMNLHCSFSQKKSPCNFASLCLTSIRKNLLTSVCILYKNPFLCFLGENLLLRRTQGDLLQKLRQLQQWRQQQEEHLLQDKEKQLSVLRDKERRLHAVQEYQRKILQNNNVITSRDNGPLFQVKPASFSDGLSSRPTADVQLRENMAISQARAVMSSGYNLPTKTVLLSPQHFKTTTSKMVK